MTTPRGDLAGTAVTYPAGSLTETATVLRVLPDPRAEGERSLLLTDLTPFHPLDPLWPDQPADHGTVRAGAADLPVLDTVTVARRGDGPFLVDAAIDARRAEEGVAFLVGHVVPATALDPGTTVTLLVQEERRRRLSAAHTACHLLAYALNEVTHGLWRKDTAPDSRGHHDFDRATCTNTRHDTGGSLDDYRLGKSLRKKGFDTATFLAELPGIMAEVETMLAGWIDAKAPVRIDADGPLLVDRREWVCELPAGTARMLCGGTHVDNLHQLDSMRPAASWDEEAGLLTIRNAVRVRD